MIAHGNKIKLFCGNSCKQLSSAISERLKMKLSDAEVGKFSDGEISVSIGESVRGCDVFVIQSTSTPTNDNLMELLVMIDALKRASAGRITAVMPSVMRVRTERRARAIRSPQSSSPILFARRARTACSRWIFTRRSFRAFSIYP